MSNETSISQEASHRSIAPLRLPVWGAVAGGLVAVIDFFYLTVARSGLSDIATDAVVVLAIYLLTLGILGGAGLGVIGLALVVLARIGGRRLAVIVGCAVLFGVFCYLNVTTLGGAGIRAHPQFAAIRIGFYIAGFVVSVATIFAAARLIPALHRARRPFRVTMAIVLLVLATIVYHRDATWLVNLYRPIHFQLAGAVLVLVTAAFTLAFARVRTRTCAIVGLALIVIVAIGTSLRRHDLITLVRSRIVTHTVNIGSWRAIPEAFLDRLVSLADGEIADVSGLAMTDAEKRRLDGEVTVRLDRLVPRRREMNLLVVSLDTVRADVVSGRDSSRPTTPRLARLQEDSVVFHRAYSSYPTSSYAFSSFFTGRYPACAPVATAGAPNEPKWPVDLTLAGRLRQAGLRTLGESAFNRETLGRREVFGHLRDGFEVVNPNPTIVSRSDGREVTAAAQRHLDEIGNERFFLWVHYIDPHEPYRRHDEFGFGTTPRDRYDSEVAYVDRELGRLLDELEDRGLHDRTVVCVMSDHGEEFGEHLSRYHNTSLYEEQIRVPFVVHVPGLGRRDVDRPVSLVDFLPTVLRLFDLDDHRRRNGRDLWPEIFGLATEPTWVYAELEGQRSVLTGGREMIVHGDHKLIVNRRARTEEIYDLRHDPGETKNLGGDLAVAPVLRGLMVSVRAEIEAIRRGGEDEVSTTPKEDEATWLRRRFREIRALPAAKRGAELPQFLIGILDPVFGFRHEYAVALSGPVRDDAVDFVREVFDQHDPGAAMPMILLARVLEDARLIDVFHGVETEHPLVRVGSAAVRGMLGDETALAELRGLFAFDGAPQKLALAVALMMLGDDRGIDVVLGLLRLDMPHLSVRAVRALGRSQRPELIDIAERMFTAGPWRYAILRRELVTALGRLESSTRRNRLLARLACDVEPEVSRAARRALRSSVADDEFEARLKVARVECEGDGALRHRSFDEAIQYLRDAWVASGEPDMSLALKLARVEQCHGDLAAATQVLRELEERIVSSTVVMSDAKQERRQVVQAWRRHLERPAKLADRKFPFVVDDIRHDARALPGQRLPVRLVVRNTGSHPWWGGHHGVEFTLATVVLDAAGDVVLAETIKPIGIGPTDFASGATRTMTMTLAAPRKPGTYRIVIQAGLRRPDTTERTDMPRVEVGAIDVVMHLR